MRKSLLVLIVLACSSALATDELRPSYEMRMAAEKGKELVLPSVGFISAKAKGPNVSDTQSGTRFGVEYLKGVKSDLNYGARISYVDTKVGDLKANGLNDLEFVVKSKKEYKKETVLYGVTGYWSPEKQRFKSSVNANGKVEGRSNNFSGGFGVEPYAAIVKKLKDSRWTLGVAYTRYFARQFVDESTTKSQLGDIRGGDVTTGTVAYDYFYKDSTIGASLNFYNVANERYVYPSGSEKSVQNNFFKAEVYWIGHVKPGVKFIPSLQYLEQTEGDNTLSGYQANLAYLTTY